MTEQAMTGTDLSRLRELNSLSIVRAGKEPADIWAVTVAVTGAVDASGRTSFFTPLPGWKSVDLTTHLGGRLACPILVENDCKLAALAERWKGAASDANDIVYLLAGMRTGAGRLFSGGLSAPVAPRRR